MTQPSLSPVRRTAVLSLSKPMANRGLYPVLGLPEGRSMAKWRKQCGLAITHMMARKTKALRMEFHNGCKVSLV